MPAIRRALARARLRLMLQRFVTALGWVAIVALLGAGCLIAADRLLALPFPLWSFAALGGAAVIVAAAAALMRAPRDADVAVMLDARLRLQDRVGTSLYLDTLPDEPLAAHIRQDAERALAGVSIGEAFPVRVGRHWAGVPLAAVLVAMLAMFLRPQWDPLGQRERQEEAQLREQQAAEAASRIVQARMLVEQVAGQADAGTDEDPAGMLRELAALSQRDWSDPATRQEAIAQVASVEERMAHATQAIEQQVQTLQNRLSRLDAQRRGPADRFADALRRGDFPSAAGELDLLRHRIDRGDYDASDKRILRQQLDALARQLLHEAAQEPVSPVAEVPPGESATHEEAASSGATADAHGRASQPPSQKAGDARESAAAAADETTEPADSSAKSTDTRAANETPTSRDTSPAASAEERADRQESASAEQADIQQQAEASAGNVSADGEARSEKRPSLTPSATEAQQAEAGQREAEVPGHVTSADEASQGDVARAQDSTTTAAPPREADESKPADASHASAAKDASESESHSTESQPTENERATEQSARLASAPQTQDLSQTPETPESLQRPSHEPQGAREQQRESEASQQSRRTSQQQGPERSLSQALRQMAGALGSGQSPSAEPDTQPRPGAEQASGDPGGESGGISAGSAQNGAGSSPSGDAAKGAQTAAAQAAEQQQETPSGETAPDSRLAQGTWQAQQELARMAQMQQQLRQMAQARDQLQRAMEQAGELSHPASGQQASGGGDAPASHPPGHGGSGSRWGWGVGSRPTGTDQAPRPYDTEARYDTRQREGRIIASWEQEGEAATVGEPGMMFEEAIRSARDEAARAMTEDRVPRRYHESVKEYFDQIPDAARETRQVPAAPR